MPITTWQSWKSRLQEANNAAGAKNKIIVTDGVFSMDGYVAQLDKICDLADQYDALSNGRRMSRNWFYR